MFNESRIKMKQEKKIIEKIEEFLEYLTKNYNNKEIIKEKNLIEKFGKKEIDNLIDLCMNEYFITRETTSKEEGREYFIKIKTEGLKFLSEENHKKIINEHNKTTLYLTAILVLTTILSTFIALKLINHLLIITIYGIIVLVVTIIFKKSKVIKV